MPEVGHTIQHKAVLLRPCRSVLHMVLQNKGSTPKNRKISLLSIKPRKE